MKLVLSLIVVSCLLAPTAFARQWTARGGGFTVEAEFVELKDDKVILKQNDGKLLRVPLDKLSPDDVDCVNALLQPTDMGMGSAPNSKMKAEDSDGAGMGTGKLPDRAPGLPADAAKRVDVGSNATLDDLRSADNDRIRRRLKLLAETCNVEPNPKVANLVESLLVDSQHVSLATRADAAKAMKNWSTPENVPALVTLLADDKSSAIRVPVIEALAKHKSRSAIGPLAQLLSDTSARSAAGKALKAIGPAAEDAVLKRMEGEDAWTRVEVCDILAVIGTQKSISALEKAAKDPSWLLTKPAEKALEKIKLRQRAAPN